MECHNRQNTTVQKDLKVSSKLMSLIVKKLWKDLFELVLCLNIFRVFYSSIQYCICHDWSNLHLSHITWVRGHSLNSSLLLLL